MSEIFDRGNTPRHERNWSGPYAALYLVILSGRLANEGITVEVTQTDEGGRAETLGYDIQPTDIGNPIIAVYSKSPDGALSSDHAAVVSELLTPPDFDAVLQEFTER
jgi:hypothetical protein